MPHVAHDGITCEICLREYCLIENQTRIRMHQKCSTATYHVVVGIRIQLNRIDLLLKPLQRKVGSKYRYQIVVLIVYRMRIGGHNHFPATGVIIWLTPIGLIEQLWNLIPIHVEIIIILTTELLRYYIIVCITIRIGRIIETLFLKVRRLKCDSTTRHKTIALKHLCCDSVHIFRIVNIIAYHPRQIMSSDLH